MPDSPNPPAVSIILPTFNRARFLTQALESIKAQTFTNWELIVVDDGSTDNTRELVAELTRSWPQPVWYHRQENQGAYGARNTGLDLAAGKYVAFFDSDDVWLPHHLADCATALDANPDVGWVYGACRIVDYATHRTVAPSTFYQNERPRPFLQLKTRAAGSLKIIEDPDAMRGMVSHGLYCGLQNSLIRSQVFKPARFNTTYKNEAEDLLIVIRALAAGQRFGYLDNVHAVYHIHDANSSAAGFGSVDKRLKVYEGLLRGFEDIRNEVAFSKAERRALDRSLSRVYFWELGYTLMWQNGRRKEAMLAFRRALKLWPWHLPYWKSYLIACLRLLAQRPQAP
jgi:glycosyltransferase involved in cell wall biosynthesis